MPESSRLAPLEWAKRYREQAREARLKASQSRGEAQAAFIKLAGQWQQLALEADDEAKAGNGH